LLRLGDHVLESRIRRRLVWLRRAGIEIRLQQEVRLARPVTVQELKAQWLGMMRRARTLVESLPEEEVGCLYLDAAGRVVTRDPGAASFAGLRR
jgi:PAS domain-containing protein